MAPVVAEQHGTLAWNEAMPRTPFIVVFCGKHRYCFVYSKGCEEELISTLIQYAMDDRYNFGWTELRSITSHMQTQKAGQPETGEGS